MSISLAVNGGAPLRSTPMPTWPCPTEAEVQAVADVIRSGRINYWTGTEGRTFENEYAASLGRAHGLAVANGTLALELALRAFGVGPGDEVIVPSRTFIATAAAAVSVGATPIVADIDPDSGNLTRDTVEPLLSDATRAIIPVHLGGWPADVASIVELVASKDVVVIEDCAQAHAGMRDGRPVGALGSHAAAFSFCQDKILPTGEGGMLLLDDDAAFERAWSYRDHGKSFKKVSALSDAAPDSSFKWLVDEFGSNWRMPEVIAAMGRVGLTLLPEWHAARTRNALRLADALAGVPGIRVPLPGPEAAHAFYRLYAFIEPDALASGWTRDSIIAAINAEGVPCQYGSCAEIYREEAFRGLARTSQATSAPGGRLPGAALAHENSLALFVHPTLSDSDIDDTAAAIDKVMEAATT